MKVYALILAGGSGTRMKSEVPKQFLILKNRPVLMHTIERFVEFDPSIEIVVVLPEGHFVKWKGYCDRHNFSVNHQLVAGGVSRFDSVSNGLSAIGNQGIVFIHDGVRPLVSNETLGRCMQKTVEEGNALPVLPVVESLRKVENGINTVTNRDVYVIVQTPQVFRAEEIKAAYQLGFDPAFTDDAAVLERYGKTINLVEGNRENIKITYPSDLAYAEAVLSNKF
jgi:2-C-methyl-D-erythritol 4-phosphate cytidylyltransferase